MNVGTILHWIYFAIHNIVSYWMTSKMDISEKEKAYTYIDYYWIFSYIHLVIIVVIIVCVIYRWKL